MLLGSLTLACKERRPEPEIAAVPTAERPELKDSAAVPLPSASVTAVPAATPWLVPDEKHAAFVLSGCPGFAANPKSTITLEKAAEPKRPVWVYKVNGEYCNVNARTGGVFCEGSFCSPVSHAPKATAAASTR